MIKIVKCLRVHIITNDILYILVYYLRRVGCIIAPIEKKSKNNCMKN